jgi:hypothetical protein
MCAHYGCNHCAPLPCACDSPRLAAQFFSNATAKARGLQVVRNMMAWYKGLAVDLQSTVWAFTCPPGWRASARCVLLIVDGFGWCFYTGVQPLEGPFWRLWVRAVLNEPGLGVVSNGKGINGGGVRKGNTALSNNKPVRAWLAQAVAIFKQETSPFGAARPLLYMVWAATTFGPAARARALSQLCLQCRTCTRVHSLRSV